MLLCIFAMPSSCYLLNGSAPHNLATPYSDNAIPPSVSKTPTIGRFASCSSPDTSTANAANAEPTYAMTRLVAANLVVLLLLSTTRA